VPVDRKERRSHFRGKPRPGRRVEVSFTSDEGALLRAYTRNIGVGGAFVVTTRPVKPGSPLTLAVHIPTASDPIQVLGEVRWTVAPKEDAPGHEAGMGIRFQALDVEALLALNEYFASLTGKDAD
jgi:uncharacterized protein (TIGR02266 family)